MAVFGRCRSLRSIDLVLRTNSISNEFTSSGRKGIEQALERAEAERKKKLEQKRLEMARAGVQSFQKHNIGDAARAFHTYIRILEDTKNCGEGGLMPSLFDPGTELKELLLISGIYWDLAKLYDRTNTIEKQREFHHYLEKYILFAKGMPYQVLCAETLRKYIYNDKPVHMEDFKNAYKVLAMSKCYVATALVDVIDEPTLPRLRSFRGRVLMKSGTGRAFVAWYYRNGPGLARITDRFPAPVRRVLGRALSHFARMLDVLLVN